MNYLNVLIILFSDEYQILQILHGNDIINILKELDQLSYWSEGGEP